MGHKTPEIDKILLGDNPLIGVDHLSQERARERLERLDNSKVVGVIDAALANGAQGFLFSTHPTIYAALSKIRERKTKTSLNLYPLLPYAQTYVRIATEKGALGLAQDVLSKLSWKGKTRAIAAGLTMATADPAAILCAYVDAELDLLSSNAPRNAEMKSVILHEIITDVAISFHARKLLESYADHIMAKYHVKPGFATRNFPRFVSCAKEIGLELNEIVVLTPFNRVGFQMNPSQEACEECLAEIGDSNVIAMSILAAGYLKLEDAVQYMERLECIKSFVVGTSTEGHAKETFSYLSQHQPKWPAAAA